MFDSVLKKGNVPKNRFGEASALSLVVYGGLLAVVVYLSSRPPPIPSSRVSRERRSCTGSPSRGNAGSRASRSMPAGSRGRPGRDRVRPG